MKPVRKAVLPVAGFGTRVLPATKSVPKEMLTVFDRPAIQYVVDEAREAGIEHFVFVTGRNKHVIEDYFDKAFELETTLAAKKKDALLAELKAASLPPGSASFTRQQAALGLGHAVLCAREMIGAEPFAVLLPDVLVKSKPSCLAQMVATYNEVGGNIVAVDEVPLERVSSYGVIDPSDPDSAGQLVKMKGMVEKPPATEAPSRLKITGRYILQPEIFDLLATQTPGAGGEIQLTDAMQRLMSVQDFHAFRYQGQDYDCGDKLLYLEAFAAMALAHPELGAGARAVLEGVLRK
ncbi:MAG: UTP--glucose-1-phosphate uridylyltransferase GalU [Alphaproteobacteria bacterium]|nr:UTP--glucose-1-phosphate uridylyltransferase GalU [Alphaproteobacteria bacterium]